MAIATLWRSLLNVSENRRDLKYLPKMKCMFLLIEADIFCDYNITAYKGTNGAPMPMNSTMALTLIESIMVYILVSRYS